MSTFVPKQLQHLIPPGGSFIKTERFREPAIHFQEHGYYLNAPKGSKEYLTYWREEKDRCVNGYEVDGVRITGNHYFYLNYTTVPIVDKSTITESGGSAEKIDTFPDFWDGDYYFFHAVELAREIGKHLIVLKARGKGYSHKCSAMLARNFHLLPAKKNYAFAFEKEFLTKDGLLSKCVDKMSFVDANTPWIQPRLLNQEMHKKAGYKQKIHGNFVEKGIKSEVIGVTLKDDANKSRGKRGALLLWEEAGKFPNLHTSFDVCRPSVEEGKYATGIMIVFGTGGTEDANYEGLEQLFFNPRSNNCLEFDNIWDDGAEGTMCGYFVPAYQNYEGFMDEYGNSLEDEAREFLENRRQLIKEEGDPKSYDQFTCEFPFNPREAVLNVNQNIFPVKELQEQLNSVQSKKRYNALSLGNLVRSPEGIVMFRPDANNEALFNFPTPKDVDTTGSVYVLEAPVRDSSGSVPRGLYSIGHDPYAHDESTGDSLGAVYVFKMTNRFSHSYNDCIVASYVGRPNSQDEFNRIMFMLAEYYNCKIGFENDRGDVIGYAKRHKLLHYLEEEFQMLDKRQLQSRNVRRPYGMHMTNNRKLQGQIYIRDWLNTPISSDDDEKGQTLILHTILDPALLQELIKFNMDGNFDRVMAVMIGMYHMKELYNVGVTARETGKFNDFFSRELYRSGHGTQKRFFTVH